MTDFDLTAYRERLGLPGLSPSAEDVAALQEAQIRAVPFENIDPFLGTAPDLTPACLSRRILGEGRGGYGFELNLFFAAALEALGLRPVPRLARLRLGAAEGGPAPHLVHVCAVDGAEWLLDAGFGGPGPLAPLVLDMAGPQAAPNGSFRIARDAAGGDCVLLMRRPGGELPLYAFDAAIPGEGEIAAAHRDALRGPAAPFSRHLIVNGYDGDTRIALLDRRLTVERHNGDVRHASLARAADLEMALCGRLGLSLSAETLARLWQRLVTPDGNARIARNRPG